MRLLLIDNGSGDNQQLLAICGKHEVAVLPAGSLDGGTAQADTDGFIVTGISGPDEAWETDDFARLVRLVSDAGKPVLGIGAGFDAVCYAFGGRLHELGERTEGAGLLVPTDDGARVFQGTDPLRVSQSQRWAVDDMPRDLVVLARSESGVEAVRHRTRPVFALQIRPQDFIYASDAKMVFQNILDMFGRQAGRLRQADAGVSA